MRKADGRRWSRRLPLYLTLVSAIVFPQGGYAQIGPVGLVPFDVVELFPPIQLETCGIFLLVEQVVVLQTLPVSGVQVVLPVLKGGVRLAYLSRAVSVPSSSYPLMLAPFVLVPRSGPSSPRSFVPYSQIYHNIIRSGILINIMIVRERKITKSE